MVGEKLNYFKYRFKYRFAKHLNLTVPVDVSLELSSACNQKCGYCYHADPKNLPFKRGVMGWGIAYQILSQSHELGVHSLKFNYRGEPTMNPDFKRIAASAYIFATGSTFIDRVVNSNFNFPMKGTAHDDILIGLNYMTKVKVSFDSFQKNIFEKQRAGGKLELALHNVDRFYNMKHRKTKLVIQAVRTMANKDEDLEGEIKRRWSDAVPSIRDMVTGRVNKDLADDVVKPLPKERQSCIQAHARLIFDHEGNAQMCCPDIGSKLQLGNIRTHSMDAIFNSVKAKIIRKELKDGKAFATDPCKTCPSFESYKGYKPGWDS